MFFIRNEIFFDGIHKQVCGKNGVQFKRCNVPVTRIDEPPTKKIRPIEVDSHENVPKPSNPTDLNDNLIQDKLPMEGDSNNVAPRPPNASDSNDKSIQDVQSTEADPNDATISNDNSSQDALPMQADSNDFARSPPNASDSNDNSSQDVQSMEVDSHKKILDSHKMYLILGLRC